jgi:hypothetical protein
MQAVCSKPSQDLGRDWSASSEIADYLPSDWPDWKGRLSCIYKPKFSSC